MPHSFCGGFYTSANVSINPDTNITNSSTATKQHKPVAVSHSAGQYDTNSKTETNDSNKQ